MALLIVTSLIPVAALRMAVHAHQVHSPLLQADHTHRTRTGQDKETRRIPSAIRNPTLMMGQHRKLKILRWRWHHSNSNSNNHSRHSSHSRGNYKDNTNLNSSLTTMKEEESETPAELSLANLETRVSKLKRTCDQGTRRPALLILIFQAFKQHRLHHSKQDLNGDSRVQHTRILLTDFPRANSTNKE